MAIDHGTQSGVVRQSRRAGRRFTDEQNRQIAAEYATGLSSYKLAEKWGGCHVQILQAVVRGGGKVRRRRIIDESKDSRFSYTKAQREEAIRLYQGGKTLWDVANIYGTNPTTVSRWLAQTGHGRRSGVNQVSKSSKLTGDEREAIVARCLAGESTCALADEYGITAATVRNYLVTRGYDTNHELGRPKEHCSHEDIFDRPPPDRDPALWVRERNYWVGMLITDGCVVDRGRDVAVQLSLARRDEGHLELFRQFVGGSQPINRYMAPPTPLVPKSHPASRIAVYSRQMANSLSRFGVVPRKTYTAAVIGLEDDPDFWRGAIDGDGCITSQRRNNLWTVRLCGMGPLVPQFLEFVQHRIGIGRSRVVISRRTGLLTYGVNGRRASALLSILYPDAPVALARKADRAKLALERQYGNRPCRSDV